MQPYPTAARTFTKRDNGLIRKWKKRVWLNPPYTAKIIGRWLARMAAHDCGTALIFARTETEAFSRFVWDAATAVLFMGGRINFHLPDGSRAKGNADAPTVLCAYGMNDADVLAGCDIAGRFVPLRIPRSVLGAIFAALNEGEKIDTTWRQAIAEFFDRHDGPIELDQLYRFFRAHPKASGNRNVEAKIRQQLQRGPYRRKAPGIWEMDKQEALL